MALIGSLCLIAIALGETPSHADSEPLVLSPGDWMAAPFAAILERAKDLYFRGDADAAKRMLETLRLRIGSGEVVDWPLVVETFIYLGEIYYLEGDAEGANDAFNYVLQRDPETPISPYYHNLDVIHVFESVRTKVIERLRQQVPVPPPPPPEPTPPPATVVLPFGLPQFIQGRPGPGFVYGAMQAGLGVTSVWYNVRLRNIAREHTFPNGLENQDALDQWRRERYLIHTPATIGFFVLWGVSTYDATRWHRKHPPQVGLGQSTEGTPLLMLGGHF